VLTELETHPILKAYVSRLRKVDWHGTKLRLAIAKEIGYPVVAKIESPDILHRSDAGPSK